MIRAACVAFAVIAGPVLACDTVPATDMPETVVETPLFDVSAWYEGPTTAYGHGILGDTIEAQRVRLVTPRGADGTCGSVVVDAGPGHVFEDVAPRLADLDGDGRAEVITVRTNFSLGAQLAVYRETDDGLILDATTDYIGRSNRWLSPVGAADLDGDGFVEIAFVDRPHLAKVLRVFRYRAGALELVAEAAGVTNHRIGERDIGGGIRDCGNGPEMIVATANWARLVSVRLRDGALVAEDIGAHRDRGSFAQAMACG